VSVRILVGDARAVLATLPAESVHCVVTSPPYWGLRDYGLPPMVWGGEPGCAHAWGEETYETRAPYGVDLLNPQGASMGSGKREGGTVSHGAHCARCGAWRGSLGLEPDPALYVAHLVEVFRAVRRVLRSDGICFVNLGDAYLDKQLLGLPWRVAFALQADGWWLRSEIIWHKPSPMPESVTDRPTKAHEQVFLLAKSERYFFDGEAIKEPSIDPESLNGRSRRFPDAATQSDPDGKFRYRAGLAKVEPGTIYASRNRRSVWTIPSAPFSEAHFATFPPALVEPCVKAGTSERGACPACGAPWRRVVTSQIVGTPRHENGRYANSDGSDGTCSYLSRTSIHGTRISETTGWAPTCGCAAGLAPGVVEPCVQAGTSERGCCAKCGAPWRRDVERTFLPQPDVSLAKGIKGAGNQKPMYGGSWEGVPRGSIQATTLGWAPTCACAPQPVPCVVLDPFAGAGTVGLVADRLGRDAILIELKPEYAAMAERRIREEAPLLAAVEVEAAAPAASDNGRGALAPEQLALDWAEMARVDV
jgi:DNA modification methylase